MGLILYPSYNMGSGGFLPWKLDKNEMNVVKHEIEQVPSSTGQDTVIPSKSLDMK